MGAKDTITTKYMQRNEIFADAFNYYVYGGRQVIDPNSLEELDTREIGVPYGSPDNGEQPVQRIRDVIKSVTAMTNRKTAFLILVVENQSNIHYAMAVKDMVYDALQYAKQVEKAVASHKKAGDYRGADSDEYLSGFMKNDKLMPVVTLVIYFGTKAWDGPLSRQWTCWMSLNVIAKRFQKNGRESTVRPAKIATSSVVLNHILS